MYSVQKKEEKFIYRFVCLQSAVIKKRGLAGTFILFVEAGLRADVEPVG